MRTGRMRFHPLLPVAVGTALIAALPALVQDNGNSGAANNQAHSQQSNSAEPLALRHAPSAVAAQKSAYCPGTSQNKFDCNTISAIANIRQADAAEKFNGLAIVEIGIGLVTAFAAILAAFFAAHAAEAARDTVDSFSAVERAYIVIVLDNFLDQRDHTYDPYGGTTEMGPVRMVHFDIVAHNLGRSAALITGYAFDFSETNDPEKIGTFILDAKPKIIPAAERLLLQNLPVPVAALKSKPFLWLLFATHSPLRGEMRFRYCIEVFDQATGVHQLRYMVRRFDEIDGEGRVVKSGKHGLALS